MKPGFDQTENKQRYTLTKSLAIAVVGAAALPGLATDARANMETFTLDPEHTTVAFMVSHIGYAKTLGQFTEVEGTFRFDEEAPALESIEVTIDTASVNTHHEARDNHVRSGDFLDVDNHPTMTFVGTGSERLSETTGRVTGDLTLLGETREVTLDVTLNKAGEYPYSPPGVDGRPYHIGVSARTEVDRSDWGMTYGIDNGLVGDTVEIILEFEARRND